MDPLRTLAAFTLGVLATLAAQAMIRALRRACGRLRARLAGPPPARLYPSMADPSLAMPAKRRRRAR